MRYETPTLNVMASCRRCRKTLKKPKPWGGRPQEFCSDLCRVQHWRTMPKGRAYERRYSTSAKRAERVARQGYNRVIRLSEKLKKIPFGWKLEHTWRVKKK